MLELAQPKDREAVEALAQQVQGMHLAWRPDLFAEADCLYPEERFQEAVRKRELYVAKLGGKNGFFITDSNTCTNQTCEHCMKSCKRAQYLESKKRSQEAAARGELPARH